MKTIKLEYEFDIIIYTKDDIEYRFVDRKENKQVFGNIFATIEDCEKNKTKGIMGYAP